jgi:hypothetical protein
VSQKLSTDGDSTKSNVHLVRDSKELKISCNTCPYGVATNDLKQVKDLPSFLFKLLKCLQFKVEHCRNPTLAKCGGEAQHLEKLEVWSPSGLPNV